MSTISTHTYTTRELEQELTRAMVPTITVMIEKGLVEPGAGQQFLDTHAIIIRQKNFFQRLLKEDKDPVLIVVEEQSL